MTTAYAQAAASILPYPQLVRHLRQTRILAVHGWDWCAKQGTRWYDTWPLTNCHNDRLVRTQSAGWRKVNIHLTISGVTGEIIYRKIRRRYERFWRVM